MNPSITKSRGPNLKAIPIEWQVHHTTKFKSKTEMEVLLSHDWYIPLKKTGSFLSAAHYMLPEGTIILIPCCIVWCRVTLKMIINQTLTYKDCCCCCCWERVEYQRVKSQGSEVTRHFVDVDRKKFPYTPTVLHYCSLHPWFSQFFALIDEFCVQLQSACTTCHKWCKFFELRRRQ